MYVAFIVFPKGPKWLKHVKTHPKRVFWGGFKG